MNKKKLCIATLDPSNISGLRSAAKFVYKKSAECFEPFLAYNIVSGFRNGEKDITWLECLRGVVPKVKAEKFEGMKGIGIQRILPEFEFLNYVLNISKWKEVIDSSDVFFAIGGSNNCALPFILLKKNFSIWVASTLYEDRKDRLRKESLFRKIRSYLSLSALLYFEKIIFERAQKILALSKYTKYKILEKYNINLSKIEVVHMPIKSDIFYPLDYFKRKNDCILFVGRLNDERKNIPLLLHAFAEVKKQHKNIKLKLIGKKFDKSLYKLIEKLFIQDCIEISGILHISELVTEYQNASVFVIPSFQEGLCIPGLESFSCGVPVISTKCGGPEDYVKNDYNGYLVENNNIQALASTILNFLSFSHEKRKSLGENARSYILENHNEDKIWSQFLECFNS